MSATGEVDRLGRGVLGQKACGLQGDDRIMEVTGTRWWGFRGRFEDHVTQVSEGSWSESAFDQDRSAENSDFLRILRIYFPVPVNTHDSKM
jgi:hypothetical protein